MVSAVSIWMGDRLLDFLGDPTNATFGSSVGMGDDIPSSPDPGVQGKVSLDMMHLYRLHPRVCCVQLVTSGRSQEQRGRNVTNIGINTISTALLWKLAFIVTAVEWLALSQRKATVSAASIWNGDCLLDFVGNPANFTFEPWQVQSKRQVTKPQPTTEKLKWKPSTSLRPEPTPCNLGEQHSYQQ